MKIVQMYTKINTTLVSLPSILSLLSEVALPGESIATWWCNVRTPSLKHRGVGRHLAHRKDKRKCLWNRGPRSTVNISDEKVFGPGLLHLCKGAAITSGRCSKMARRRTPPEAINVRMSFIEPNMTLWPPNNPDLNPVELGNASGDGLPLQKFQVCARTKTCNCRCVSTTYCH